MKTCTKCYQKKLPDDFYRMQSTYDGLRPDCKTCVNNRQKEYRLKNKSTISSYRKQYYRDNREIELAKKQEWRADNKDSIAAYNQHYYSNIRKQVLEHYGNKCAKCNSQENLEIDHVNGDGNKHRLELLGDQNASGHAFYLALIRNNFPDDYELQTLCDPCHNRKPKKQRET